MYFNVCNKNQFVPQSLTVYLNVADYLSRKPVEPANGEESVEQYVNYVFENSLPRSITHDEVIKHTKTDLILQELIKRIAGRKVNFSNRISKHFDNIFHELSVTDSGVVMRNNLIVIPDTLIDRVIDIAHEGHQGITKTKALIRTKVWFVRLDEKVEERLKNCFSCQVNSTKVKTTDMPDGPWQIVSIDFYGPTPSNTWLMVLLCDYGRFPVVEDLISTASRFVIPALHSICSLLGISIMFRTDNGPPFNGKDFENFCSLFGIRHRLITPYWPRANGEVEQFNRNLTKVMRNASIKNESWKKELNFFLGSYRASPHTSTGVPPAGLMYRYCASSRLISMDAKRSFLLMIWTRWREAMIERLRIS